MYSTYNGDTNQCVIKMEEDVEEEHDGTVRQLLLKIGDELNRCWTIQLELFKCLDEKLTKLPDRIVSSLQDILIDMHHGTGIKKEDTYIISDALRKPARTMEHGYDSVHWKKVLLLRFLSSQKRSYLKSLKCSSYSSKRASRKHRRETSSAEPILSAGDKCGIVLRLRGSALRLSPPKVSKC